MPQSSHNPDAELHNIASHAHAVAAVSHSKADHQSASELSDQEHSREVLRRSKTLDPGAVKPAIESIGGGEKVEVVHAIHPGLPLY